MAEKLHYDSATGMTFKEAFAEARAKALKGGPKTFEWNGKSYGTKLAGEEQGKYREDSTIKAGVAAGKASEGRTRARPEDYEKDEYKKGRFENKMNRSLGRTTDPENAAKIQKYNETRKKNAEERAATAKSVNKTSSESEGSDAAALGATGAALAAAALLNSKRGGKEDSLEKMAREREGKAKSGTSLRMPGSRMDKNDPYSMTLGSDLDPKRMMKNSRLSGDVEYKKGGKVKKMASGGSASSRGDGCAMRGKTKGRMI